MDLLNDLSVFLKCLLKVPKSISSSKSHVLLNSLYQPKLTIGELRGIHSHFQLYINSNRNLWVIYTWKLYDRHRLVARGRESPAAMSLCHTETNLWHTEASLPDRHTVHEPPPYCTQASAVQNDFFETLFYVYNKRV